MIKKISKINNIKTILTVVIVIAIMQNFELPKNVFKIIKKNYDVRLINSYKHYCHNESIGFLSYIKNKYKFNKPIEVKNYFISPNPSWFFLQKNTGTEIKDKMILLGYSQYETIKFSKKKNYFISINDIKNLKNIKSIFFDSKKEIIEKTVKLEIYQETSGEIKKIHMLDLNIITKGKNVIELNKKLSNTLPNSKIIVKFINFPKKNNLNLSNLEFYKSNEIDLSKHIIYERSDSCYLISKND